MRIEEEAPRMVPIIHPFVLVLLGWFAGDAAVDDGAETESVAASIDENVFA